MSFNSDDPDRARIARLLAGDHLEDVDPGGIEPRFRFVLLGAILELFERLASEGPLVVVLDDIQWADSSSLLVLNRLDRRVAPFPVAILASETHAALG